MEPLFFVMAIMGCADGGSQCIDARILPAHYATVAQCRAALTTTLAQNTDLPFPMLSADCRAQGQRLAKTEQRARPRG